MPVHLTYQQLMCHLRVMQQKFMTMVVMKYRHYQQAVPTVYMWTLKIFLSHCSMLLLQLKMSVSMNITVLISKVSFVPERFFFLQDACQKVQVQSHSSFLKIMFSKHIMKVPLKKSREKFRNSISP